MTDTDQETLDRPTMIHTSCRSESSFIRLGRLDKSLLDLPPVYRNETGWQLEALPAGWRQEHWVAADSGEENDYDYNYDNLSNFFKSCA